MTLKKKGGPKKQFSSDLDRVESLQQKKGADADLLTLAALLSFSPTFYPFWSDSELRQSLSNEVKKKQNVGK